VAFHGSPPIGGGYLWISPNPWRFMDRPLRNGGGSWIALEKWWRFMDRPRKTVAVHGSPTKCGGSWIAPEKTAQFMDHSTSGVSWIDLEKTVLFMDRSPISGANHGLHFMDYTRPVAVHGSPPKKRRCSWIAPQ